MAKTQKELRKEAEEVKAWYDGLDAEFEYQERVTKEVEKMKNRKYVVKRPNEKPIEAKKPFYFTYGVDDCYPFKGGWTIVMAKDIVEAKQKYNQHFGLTIYGFGRYCTCYTEEAFMRTEMYKNGNWGQFLQFVLE